MEINDDMKYTAAFALGGLLAGGVSGVITGGPIRLVRGALTGGAMGAFFGGRVMQYDPKKHTTAERISDYALHFFANVGFTIAFAKVSFAAACLFSVIHIGVALAVIEGIKRYTPQEAAATAQ